MAAAETRIIKLHELLPLLKEAAKQTIPFNMELRKLSRKGGLQDLIDSIFALSKASSAATASSVNI
jgi:hypothetical protein